jgi:hypothetical protein
MSMLWGSIKKIANPLEEDGLAMFVVNGAGESEANFPDSEPEGIPKTFDELEKMPKYVKAVKCNNRFGGGNICFNNKWSCTSALRDAGSDCICPHVGKRTSWHMG